ncbi:putative sporulation protein YtxC [Mesobacillus persicus]|uniref:Putative sporulation protein YtxC n=1 Tax=Mesobacillus persicus TaxID=930146 RepID=A0A1H7XTD5_9BACI|nr:putative sporulation protein YtxC [Mesobacillus persicus]SEM37040.1 putative sporulation protein YtxC [Mesobacillus persicus]
MIEIIFQKDRDAHNMFGHIAGQLSAVQLENGTIQLDEARNKIKICLKNLPNAAFHTIRESVYEFIVLKKRDDWFREILSERFFYNDPHEQEQILEIIYSVVEGNREDLTPFLNGSDEKKYVFHAIDELFKGNISFSFDSFVVFRLKPFFNKLRNYVEVAIDEYKLEQEYQMFVQTLRDFLSGRPALHECIHLILDEETIFYDENYREMKRSELVKGIDRKLLGNHPIYVDSVTIAPLLSMAPSTIYLYTNQPEQPLVRTIGNIFEERVKTAPVKSFYENKQLSNEKVQ